MLRMALQTLSAANAAALDKELMGAYAFSVDQLMELAGLSVAQCLYKIHPPARGPRALVVCGPGNNGGDGLVAARHLAHFGYRPTVCYPKQSKNELYQRLVTQLRTLDVPFAEGFGPVLKEADCVVDAIFGFSFSGEVREPFPVIIAALEEVEIPVLSIDAPSSWNIETGPPKEGPGSNFHPAALISLTAPKPLVKFYNGRHFLGGRFLPSSLAKRFDLDSPPYQGCEQSVEIDKNGRPL